jgi:AraC family transcriptional regulator
LPLTRTELYRADFLKVRYVACRSASSGLSNVEYSEAPELVMPLKGAFVGHFSSERRVLAEPNVALLFVPGRPYKVSHPAGAEDDCLVLEFSQSAFQEVATTYNASDNLRDMGSHSLLSPPAMACRNLLWRRLREKFADALEVEETGVTLLSHAWQGFLSEAKRTRVPVGNGNSRILEQIEAAKIALMTNPGERWTLANLADHVKSSPFHLTRMFHKRIGVPLHRYLLHTRLAKAIDLVLETNQDLTTIAFALGFSSHSHFTAVFRQLVGLPPQEFRRSATLRKTVEARSILLKQLSN